MKRHQRQKFAPIAQPKFLALNMELLVAKCSVIANLHLVIATLMRQQFFHP
jgi:hypothetical protein